MRDTVAILGRWIYDWQTLLSGLLALFAAVVTVRNLKKQILQGKKQENDRLRRQHGAARATLPLTLSGLVETMRQILAALHQVKSDLKQQSLVQNFNPPPPPTEAIEELQQIILSTDKPDVIQPISEIIRQMQTLWARVEVLRDPTQQAARAGLSIELNDWIIQAAKVHALIESLFDYARCEAENGPANVKWERAESVLVQMYIYDEALKAIVQRKFKKSPSFWQLS